jgi:type IX secretion system PorP/SprF family membrane protein
MNKLIVSYILLLISYLGKAQQDPQYSQYMFNQLVINPAYTGTKEALSAVVDLRKQWVAMPGSPQTGTISMHGPVFKGFGIGGHLIAESIGPTSWTAAYADLGYHFKLGRGKLSFGLSGGIINYNVNANKLDYVNGGEPMLNYTGQRTRFDVSAGFYYYSQSFYIGGSVTHLTSPNLYNDNSTVTISPTVQKNVSLFFSLQPHSFLYAGKGFQVNDNLVINPSVMIKNIQGSITSFDVNCNFLLKNRIWLGVSLRSGYGIVALAQVYITNKFKIGYAYDLGLNKIGIAGQSSHEVVLSYDFNVFKSKILSPRYL